MSCRVPPAVAAPTRRDYVRYGGALATGAVAGCLGGDRGAPATTSAADASDGTGETEPVPDRYTATIAPVGDVEFDSVPEDVFTILTHHAGMALALGRGDAINAMHAPEYNESLWGTFLDHLDGVSVDWTGLYSSWPPTKEKLYDLDSDVHLADPAKVATADGWDDAAIAEIRQNVGPWFGNSLSDVHQEPPAAYAGSYEYYTLWEIFERVAAVFQERRRYEALAAVHDDLLATVEERLPPATERPSAALVLFSVSDDRMWGYRLNQPGYYAAHTRPLDATDALADVVGPADTDSNGNIELDYEMLLAADPDVLLVLGPMAQQHDIADIRADLSGHSVASEITAVDRGHVYTQGTRNQGPLVNLFQLEMTAKQLYPEQFGEWPGYVSGEPYPDVQPDEQLFDRQRVADVVTGGETA